MLTQEIINYALGIAALVSIGANLYSSIKKPQEQSEINDKIFDERMLNMKEAFRVETSGLKELVTNLRDNHLHTIEEKMNKHIENQTINEREVAGKLGGIDAKLEILIKSK